MDEDDDLEWEDFGNRPQGRKAKEPVPPVPAPGNEAAILEARHLAEAAKGKIRESAKVWHLSDEHFVQIVEWQLAGVPSQRIVDFCDKELGLPPAKVPRRQGLSEFWQEFAPFWLIARRRQNHRTVEALNAEIAASPLSVDQALRDEIKQRAWELLQHPNPPEKLIKPFLNAVLKLRDQDDRKEDRALDREKFAASQRSKIEAGLEAMRAEIVGNAKAMEVWEKLREAIAA